MKKRTLFDIAESLRTQDNRCTQNPIFIVQRERRIGSEDGDDYYWVEKADWEEISGKEAEELDAYYEDHGEEKKGFQRVRYVVIWEFVSAFLTERGAEDYIAINGHNLTKPRIYVEGGFRNHEWETIRAFLIAPPAVDAEAILAARAKEEARMKELQGVFDGTEKEMKLLEASHAELLESLLNLVALLPDPEMNDDKIERDYVIKARAAIENAKGAQ